MGFVKCIIPEVARRVRERWGTQCTDLEGIIAEEIEKAAEPAVPEKTRGQVVAEMVFQKATYEGSLLMMKLSPPKEDFWTIAGSGYYCDEIRADFSKLIDAERASAAREERERLASKFDQLGNQAAADVVRE